MKKRFAGCSILLLLAFRAIAATAPIFINDIRLSTPPQIDATAFLNRGTMDLNTIVPFDFQNTLYFTNRGNLFCSPGYHFDTVDDLGFRRPADTFINDRGAVVSAPSTGGQGGISISATNIVVRGEITTDYLGLLSIEGQNLDLSRSLIDTEALLGGSRTIVISNMWFLPDVGMYDEYWGIGEVGTDLQRLMTVAGAFVQIQNPPHTVTNAGFPFPSLISWGLSRPSAFVVTNKVNDSNYVVQAIFVGNSDTNVSIDAYWFEAGQATPTKNAVVRLSSTEVNPVTGLPETRQFYLVDSLATIAPSNFVVFNNLNNLVTYRPANYDITRVPPLEFGPRARSNAVVRGDLFTKFYGGVITNGQDYTNTVVTNIYSSYQVFCTDGTAGTGITRGGSDAAVYDGRANLTTTNVSGKVSIDAKSLNLEKAHIRGQGAVLIQAEEITSTEGTVIDAPILYYVLGRPGGDLQLKNLAGNEVARLYGPMSMYSAFWTNSVETSITNIMVTTDDPPQTNEMVTDYHYDVLFHIFMVDSALSAHAPVEMNGLVLQAKNSTIADPINVTEKLGISSESLTVNGKFSFGDPFSPSTALLKSWTATNFPNLLYLTNSGTILAPGIINLGADRAVPYQVISITGTNVARSHYIVCDSLVNSGSIVAGAYQESPQGVTIFPAKGVVDINARSAVLDTGNLQSGGDIIVAGEDVKLRNFQITSGGKITLSVTGNLRDSGPEGGNRFQATDGFSLPQKPAKGDLIGSSIECVLGPNLDTVVVWAGEDRGASSRGYTNNAAIGRLFLNGESGSAYLFEPAGEKNALYVDLLELSSAVAADMESAIRIADNFTIYFAASNVAIDKLDGALGGRLQLVKDYAGPRSSIDVRLPDGRVVSMSLYMRESFTIDSDGDGIANGNDLSPLDGALITDFKVVNKPPLTAVITWGAVPNVDYRVEYSPAIGSPVWTLVESVKNTGTEVKLMSVEDVVPSGAGPRYYRIVNNPLEALVSP